MTVTVNGQPVNVAEPCTVRGFLVARGLDDAPCAVEVNRRLVPKTRHHEHSLCDGDVIEVVTLVGGG